MTTFDPMAEYKITEQERQELLAAIGQSITSWSAVETALYRIFHVCLGVKASNPSAAAFNAVENFRSKLAMTDAVVRAYLGTNQLLSIWKRRVGKADTLSKNRNFLAHGCVVVFQFGKSKSKPYAFGATPMRPRPTKDRGAAREKRLDLKDVERLNIEFLSFATHLAEFCKKLPQP